jgi:hypothetical protein
MQKLLFQATSEDRNIRIFATWKWAINPNDITSLYGNGYFISISRCLKLKRIEALKRMLLLQPEISPINRYLAHDSNIFKMLVFPKNLQKQGDKDICKNN